jgi:hypothetical protein
MLCGLLMELDDHNCWTIAEVAGHRGPHRLQRLCRTDGSPHREAVDICRLHV